MLVRESESRLVIASTYLHVPFSSAPLQKRVYSRNMKPAQPIGNMALNSPTRNTRTPRVPETGALGMSHCIKEATQSQHEWCTGITSPTLAAINNREIEINDGRLGKRTDRKQDLAESKSFKGCLGGLGREDVFP